MSTEFSCDGCQPADVDSAPLTFSLAYFFGLYGPPLATSGIHSSSTMKYPQSLYGTLSRPTVQSSRGSTETVVRWPSMFKSSTFHVVESTMTSGSPVAASVLKKLTRFCVG